MNVDHQRVPRGHMKNSKGKRKSNDSLKVVYISSPMKVKTSASRFRSLVQQLTGKNSDIAQYMDDSNNNNHASRDHFYDCNDDDDDDQSIAKENCSSISPPYGYDTPTSSDSLTGSGCMDHNMFVSQFDGIFSSNSFYDPSELDVLGSFDELL